MSEIAKAGLTTVLDVADNTTAAVSTAVKETVGATRDTAHAVVDVLGDTVENALDELEELRQKYLDHARKIVDAVTDVV